MYPFDQFTACIIGGAIGDAYGGQFENQVETTPSPDVFVWGNIETEREYFLSDDTQLTLATCESIIEKGKVDPEAIGQKFVEWYQKGKLSGLGASTLQSIKGMANGGHWWLVGRKGEHAAGNGAAMRIAPLAFALHTLNRDTIRDLSRITHHNDEAYAGALAVVAGIQLLLQEGRMDGHDWLSRISENLPDTKVKDRLIRLMEVSKDLAIEQVAEQFGKSGYVVESVPLALFAVTKSWEIGFRQAIEQLIHCGGDADTNASIMGQIAGSELGLSSIPQHMVHTIEGLDGYIDISNVLAAWKDRWGKI